VVASNNLKAAAENEGQALLIIPNALQKRKEMPLKFLQKQEAARLRGQELHCFVRK
jgi:hypothetical protein